MNANMGTLDRIIRFAIAIALAGIAFGGLVTGVWAIVCYVVAAVMALTSLIRFCPAYLPFGIKTCKVD